MSADAGVVTAERAVERSRRPVTFDAAWLLSLAMLVSGILTYAFHIGAARTLGPRAYGEIAILWGAVFLVAIVLFRPLEQTLSRWIANRIGEGDEVRTVLRSIGLVTIGILVVLAGGTVLAWNVLSDRLFHGDDAMTAMLVAGVVGYGASYLVRGIVGGVRWFAGYGIVLLADSIVRLLAAAPLIAVPSKHVAGAAIVAAAFGGALAPLFFLRRWVPALHGGKPGARFDYRGTLRFAAPAGVVAAADQLLVNGSPLLVILLGHGGTRAAGVVFAATMLVRAPVYVFQGVAASLLPNFTLLGAADSAHLASILRRTIRILVASGIVIVAGVAVCGPTAMRLIYGADFGASRLALVLLGGSVALYLASATFLQALLALDRGLSVSAAWFAATVALVGSYLAVHGDEVRRVSVALLVATALNAAIHWLLLAKVLHQGRSR